MLCPLLCKKKHVPAKRLQEVAQSFALNLCGRLLHTRILPNKRTGTITVFCEKKPLDRCLVTIFNQ